MTGEVLEGVLGEVLEEVLVEGGRSRTGFRGLEAQLQHFTLLSKVVAISSSGPQGPHSLLSLRRCQHLTHSVRR